MNLIFETQVFSKIFDSCDPQEKKWINKVKIQLTGNLKVGKPIRFVWFREKKFMNKRLFFLINENSKKVILISFGVKKDQQKIIDHILLNKKRYLHMIH